MQPYLLGMKTLLMSTRFIWWIGDDGTKSS